MAFWINSKGKEYYGEGGFLKEYIDGILKKHREEVPIDHPDDSVTDDKIGARTITLDGGTVTENLTSLFQNIADRIAECKASVNAAADEFLEKLSEEAAERQDTDVTLLSNIGTARATRTARRI